jgi:hypothetical protein
VRALLRIDASAVSVQQHQVLLTSHTSAVNLVSLAASLAVDANTQLQHIQRSRDLGYASFKLAVRLDKPSIGLQLLEWARGVLWMQVLHSRDPQLEHIPNEYAITLRSLLQAGAGPTHVLRGASTSATTDQSMELAQHSRLQEMLRKICSLPGSGEFVRGSDE